MVVLRAIGRPMCNTVSGVSIVCGHAAGPVKLQNHPSRVNPTTFRRGNDHNVVPVADVHSWLPSPPPTAPVVVVKICTKAARNGLRQFPERRPGAGMCFALFPSQAQCPPGSLPPVVRVRTGQRRSGPGSPCSLCNRPSELNIAARTAPRAIWPSLRVRERVPAAGHLSPGMSAGRLTLNSLLPSRRRFANGMT